MVSRQALEWERHPSSYIERINYERVRLIGRSVAAPGAHGHSLAALARLENGAEHLLDILGGQVGVLDDVLVSIALRRALLEPTSVLETEGTWHRPWCITRHQARRRRRLVDGRGRESKRFGPQSM